MLTGLYAISFRTEALPGEGGLVAFHDGAINGGDSRYLYQGRYEEKDGKLEANLEITLYGGNPNSIFGPLQNFRVSLSGECQGESSFSAQGGTDAAPGRIMYVQGEKKADLVQ